MVEIGLGFIIQIYYDSKICKNYLKIIGQKKNKMMEMTQPLKWRNVNVTTLNATLQFLVVLAANPRVARDNYFYGGFINFFFFTI